MKIDFLTASIKCQKYAVSEANTSQIFYAEIHKIPTEWLLINAILDFALIEAYRLVIEKVLVNKHIVIKE